MAGPAVWSALQHRVLPVAGRRPWSTPIRVNQTPAADRVSPPGNNQAFPYGAGPQRRHSGGDYDFHNNTNDWRHHTATDAFVVHCRNCANGSWGQRVTDASFDAARPRWPWVLPRRLRGLGSNGAAVFHFRHDPRIRPGQHLRPETQRLHHSVRLRVTVGSPTTWRGLHTSS